VYSCASNKIELRIPSHGAGIRTFAVSPSDEYLATIDESQNLTIHKLRVEQGPLGKKYVAADQEARFGGIIDATVSRGYSSYGCGISWAPSSSASGALTLAVPSVSGSLLLYTKDAGGSKWNESVLVTSEHADLSMTHAKDASINIVRLSPNGLYAASADSKGVILIWDLRSSNPIRSFICGQDAAEAVYDMQWGPNIDDNYLLMVTSTSWAVVDDPVNVGLGHVPPCAPPPSLSPANAERAESDQHKGNSSVQNLEADSTTNAKRIKKLGKDRSTDDDDSALFAADSESAAISIDAIKSTTASRVLADDEDSDVMDDDFVDTKPTPFAGAVAENGSFTPYIHGIVEPSSTVFDEKWRRYMVWNATGNIICRKEDGGNRIEIKFADLSGKNKNQSFLDSEDLKLGTLGQEGAFFANQPDEDDSDGIDPVDGPRHRKGSLLHYHAFPGHDANETFSVQLANNEIADCVATGTHWSAAATSKNLLRIFSNTGLQLFTCWLKGHAVCAAGFGSKLTVIYNDGCSLSDGTPHLAAECFDISANGVTQEIAIKVPVTAGGAQLEWAGYSDDGILYVMDSEGLLSALMNVAGWQWIPMLDVPKVSKRVDHKYWPVAIKGLNLCYVLLNGESKPAIYPQPVIAIRALEAPIVATKEGKDKGEGENERAKQFMMESLLLKHVEGNAAFATSIEDITRYDTLMQERKVASDKALLRIFSEACKLQRIAQSADIALRIQTPNAIQLAIQIAQHFNRPSIIKVLTSILEFKQNEELAAQQLSYQSQAEADQMRSQSSQSGGVPARKYHTSFESNNDDSTYDDGFLASSSSPSLSGGGLVKKLEQKRNAGAADAPVKPSAAPVNRFAQSTSPLSPNSAKKRSAPADDIRNLRSSPSPKKPTLFVSNSVFNFRSMINILFANKFLFTEKYVDVSRGSQQKT
jgi:hypothetical protein